MSGISKSLLRVDMKVVLTGASKRHPDYILIFFYFVLTDEKNIYIFNFHL